MGRTLSLMAILAVAIAIEVWLGALPTSVFGHDQFTFLDGGWRIICGQTPHVDFHSYYGVLLWKPISWGLRLGGDDARGLGIARAFFTALIGTLFLVGMRRQPWAFRFPILVLATAFVSTPRALGEFPSLVSHAMFYNRVGYALVCYLMLDHLFLSGFYRRRIKTESQDTFNRGVLSGLAIACVFLLKVSFLPLIAILLTVAAICFGTSRQQVAGVATGAAVGLLVGGICLDFRPAAYFNDLATSTRLFGHMIGPRLTPVVVRDWPLLLIVLGAGLLVSLRTSGGSKSWVLRYGVVTIAVIACDMLGRATNSMGADLPLSAWWCVLGSALLLAESRGAKSVAIAAALLLPVAAPVFLGDFAGVLAAARLHRELDGTSAAVFDSARLRSWRPVDWNGEKRYANENGQAMVRIVNDGIQSLRALTRDEESVATLAAVNPFSYALGRRPPAGGWPWLAADESFSAFAGLEPRDLFGDARILVVQCFPGSMEPRIAAVLRAFPDLLTKQYSRIGGTGSWELYRRVER